LHNLTGKKQLGGTWEMSEQSPEAPWEGASEWGDVLWQEPFE